MELKEFFHKAYTGEAKAALRLKVFADKAEEEGYPQMAKLFKVISFSEEIHGTRSLKMLKEIKNTEDNLASSFESETQVAEVAYDEFLKEAEKNGDETAARIFSQSRDVEVVHSKLYKKALNHMVDESETTYHVCKVCGYVSDSILPDQCPVCGVGKDHFVEF